MLIDVRRKQKLARIVAYKPSVMELHHSKAVVKNLEDSFLLLARKNMAEHKTGCPLRLIRRSFRVRSEAVVQAN